MITMGKHMDWDTGGHRNQGHFRDGGSMPPAGPGGRRRRRVWPWLLLAGFLAAVVVVCGVTIAAAGNQTYTPPGQSTKTVVPDAGTRPVTGTPAAKVADPKPADFKLTLKTLKQECFGSAGCNVTFRIDLTYVGTVNLNPDVTYELTYAVSGGEDPLQNVLTVTGDSFSRDEQEFIGTKSRSSKLSAKVTSVERL